MNSIELIAIKKLEECLRSAIQRCDEKNSERMNHERIFILRDIMEAWDIVRAIKENNKLE